MTGLVIASIYLLAGFVFMKWALRKLRHDCYRFPSPAFKFGYCLFLLFFWLPFSLMALAHRAMGR
jgi:hypothetical protein